MNQILDCKRLKIYYLGHSGFALHRGTHKIVIDPFLTNAPMARLKPNQISATDILITHGHADHGRDVGSGIGLLAPVPRGPDAGALLRRDTCAAGAAVLEAVLELGAAFRAVHIDHPPVPSWVRSIRYRSKYTANSGEVSELPERQALWSMISLSNP